ncbi:MAG: MogA/MoaB family molybdenum cofactor biosynthesis protein [Deltaproteobacteria bacterium]|nr:MogA/MoaB family molybdenum cofactor biosynthesis protein [Deltaproteobacteria bacterium]
MPDEPRKAHDHHRETSPRDARCFVLTVSDTRDPDTDRSGRLIGELVEGAGLRLSGAEIVPDEPARIRASIEARLADPATDVILVTGGTGVAPRDRTVEVVRELLERELPGFGEIFRMLSFREIGAAAMLSRALAGVARGKAVFALPGSADAVKLAMNQIILPEIGHLLRELRKQGSG